MSTRDLSQETLSLFDAPLPPAAPAVEGAAREEQEEKGPVDLARDFVRWCCSVGPDFRNSPDVTNLRYWAQKSKIKITDKEEAEILDAARPLFQKRLEQLVRKAESPA